jgi:hypothetical protein
MSSQSKSTRSPARSKSTRSPARSKGWRSAPPALGSKRSVSALEGSKRQISGNAKTPKSFHKNFVFNPNSTDISRHEFLRNVRKILGIKIAKLRNFDPDDPNDPRYVKDFLKVFAKGELFLLEDQSENGPHFNGCLVGPDPTYADLWIAADELMINDETTLNRFIESFLLGDEYRNVPIVEIVVKKNPFHKSGPRIEHELTKDEDEYLLKYFADSANPNTPLGFRHQGNPVIVQYHDRQYAIYCHSFKDLVDKIGKVLAFKLGVKLLGVYPKLPIIRVWSDYRYEDTDDEESIHSEVTLKSFKVTSEWVSIRVLEDFDRDDVEVVKVKNGNYKIYINRSELIVFHSDLFNELPSGEPFLSTLKNQPWVRRGRICFDRGFIGIFDFDDVPETEESFDRLYSQSIRALDYKNSDIYVRKKGVVVNADQGGHDIYTIKNKDNLTIGILVNLEDCGDCGDSEDSSD